MSEAKRPKDVPHTPTSETKEERIASLRKLLEESRLRRNELEESRRRRDEAIKRGEAAMASLRASGTDKPKPEDG